MITFSSSVLMQFAEDHKLMKNHCTVRIDPLTLVAKYIITDDVCVYQIEELVVGDVYFDRDKEAVFSFFIPTFLNIINLSNKVKITYTEKTNIVEVSSIDKKFTVTIAADNNYIDNPEIPFDITYSSLKPYAKMIKAIKVLKGLANDLMTTSEIEFGETLWTVSLQQCVLFGEASGIKGSMASSLFEQIYNFEAEVGMASDSKAIVRGDYKNSKYYIIVPIKSKTNQYSESIPKMIALCKRKVCDCEITNDVSSVVSNLLKSLKKEQVIIRFSNGRFDVTYDSIQWSLTTINDKNVESISLKVPNKMLNPVLSIIESPAEVYTNNGGTICLMRDNLGMMLTGIAC